MTIVQTKGSSVRRYKGTCKCGAEYECIHNDLKPEYPDQIDYKPYIICYDCEGFSNFVRMIPFTRW